MTASLGPRCRPCSPAAGPLEDEDLLCEILLRLPPQPSSLPRASAVCKRWRRLVSDPDFSRRFCHHHRRNPPVLGLFIRGGDGIPFEPTLDAPNRVPPGRFSLPRRDGAIFISLGCRHGLVLILNIRPIQVLVWDPINGKQHRLDIPTWFLTHGTKSMNGAVLRAARDIQQFHVVLTVVDNVDEQNRQALACVYSSETGIWGDLISAPVPSKVPTSLLISDDATMVCTIRPGVLLGDSLYWILSGNFAGILNFDLKKQSLAVIQVPRHILQNGFYNSWIVRAEGGGLGLLWKIDHSFQLWKRKTDCDAVVSWVLERTIELNNLLPLCAIWSEIILGFAEENNAVFVWTDGLLFMVHLDSLQFKELCEPRTISYYHPFESVYTPGNSMPSHIH
ncbi:F-box protein At5g03970-like [Triticum dicoccoides]|uniref:F-box protein At5g03970-like n=1 Tax=Triticum dicoccoides TaxID=85692 RepID=UPI00188FE391|nr:F-box protein At5g03970-like [Triticum dicoccoides]